MSVKENDVKESDAKETELLSVPYAHARRLALGVAWAVLWLWLSAPSVSAQVDVGKKASDRNSGGTKAGTSGALDVGRAVKIKDPTRPGNERTVYLRPNEGYLALSTVPKAGVTLTALKGKRPPIRATADQDGLVNIPKLAPGKYRVEIKLLDYEPATEELDVVANDVSTGKIIPLSKYGTITLMTDTQENSFDGKIRLDERELLPKDLKVAKGMVSIPRIPVGGHKIEVSRTGYLSRAEQIEVKPENLEVGPGEQPPNLWNMPLERVTGTLIINSTPGARVYVDGENREQQVASDGNLRIPGLLLGEHKIRLELFGFETTERAVTFSLDKREVREPITLVSIVEDSEGNSEFSQRKKDWFPAQPAEWTLKNDVGVEVRGNNLALLKSVKRPNRDFGIYGDFTLFFHLRLLNGKGAAWVVRARDQKNYYLFELTTAKSKRGERRLVFSRVVDGKLEELDASVIPPDIERANEQFRIQLAGEGSKFWACIEVNTPNGAKTMSLGKTFTDYTFDKGGIGLRSSNDAEFFIFEQFLVIPRVAIDEQCKVKR